MMWTGLLSETEIEGIMKRLPDVKAFQAKTAVLSPDVVALGVLAYGPDKDSSLAISAACFVDLGNTLWAAHYALCQCLAHGAYYRKRQSPHAEIEATLFERYYADDAALRLYSSGEHLASAIISMLDVPDARLEPFWEKRTSLQATVGAFLLHHMTDHPITAAISLLVDSPDWRAAILYRNRLVHEQPPLVSGLALQYRRCKRWQPSADGKWRRIAIGAGDAPDHTMDEIKSFLMSALRRLLEASVACFGFFEHLEGQNR